MFPLELSPIILEHSFPCLISRYHSCQPMILLYMSDSRYQGLIRLKCFPFFQNKWNNLHDAEDSMIKCTVV